MICYFIIFSVVCRTSAIAVPMTGLIEISIYSGSDGGTYTGLSQEMFSYVVSEFMIS